MTYVKATAKVVMFDEKARFMTWSGNPTNCPNYSQNPEAYAAAAAMEKMGWTPADSYVTAQRDNGTWGAYCSVVNGNYCGYDWCTF